MRNPTIFAKPESVTNVARSWLAMETLTQPSPSRASALAGTDLERFTRGQRVGVRVRRAIAKLATVLMCLSAVGPLSPALANPEKVTVKKFGQWRVLSSVRWSVGDAHYPPYVEITQVHNPDENDIGDMIHGQWHPSSSEISLRFQIFCGDQGGFFAREGAVSGQHWLSIGAAAATAELRTMTDGWINEAAQECKREKPKQIFKMAQLKRAIQAFLQSITGFTASEKARV
jgi:hypothetical protein